jgi:Zn-dependent protease
MKAATAQLGTIAGIRPQVHASWLVALLLLTVSLSVELAHSSGRAAPLVGLITALALFASVIAHELGHALVARARGVGVSSITLFVFGGIARLDGEPRRARDLIAIAVAGPLVSIGIGVGTLGLASSGLLPAALGEPVGWLGRVNLGLAVFNLLPGLPLDGGQILQGVLWALRGDRNRATIGAARAGRAIGWTLLVLAGARALFGTLGDGLWLGFLGWFLLAAARSSAETAALRTALEGAPVADAMSTRYPAVDGAASLSAYVRGVIAADGRRAHVVLRGGDIIGVATVERVLSVPREVWDATTVADVAIAVGAMPIVPAGTTLFDVYASIGDAPFAFVRDEASIVGVVERERLANIVAMRVELANSTRSGGTSRERHATAWT